MAPTTSEPGLTGVDVVILVVCVIVFASFLISLIIWLYRSDKRRAELNQQLSRTPTPTAARPLGAAGPRGNMADVPQRQGIFIAPPIAQRINNPVGAGSSSTARPDSPSPDSAGQGRAGQGRAWQERTEQGRAWQERTGQGRAATWSPRQYGQGASGARPQKAVPPRPDAVPARSALSSRSGVPNGVVSPQTGYSVGSAGRGYWHAR